MTESKDKEKNENLLKDIKSLKDQNIYLISKSLEDKIPDILSFISGDSTVNPIPKKIELLKYLVELFRNVEYNSEIFSCKTSNGKEKLNIFEVIIHEFVMNTKSLLNKPNEEQIKNIENYKEELKNIFTILLSAISLDKKTYQYIFSFLVNYLNQKNNKIETNQKLTSEQINKDNIYRKKILTLDDSLNILLFIKLISNEHVKKADPCHNSGLFELAFSDQTKNISFNIDNEYNLVNNVTKDKIVKLEENKFINILFRINLKDSLKIEIYQDNKKIDFTNDTIAIKDNEKAKIKEKYEIKSINFFKNFIGECSNIIVFKNKKVEGLPKFFLHLKAAEKAPKSNSMAAFFDQSSKPKDSTAKQELGFNTLFERGIHNEELFNILLKQELKDDVEQNNIDNAFSNGGVQDKIPLNDIKDFLEKILAIYIPSRYEISNELGSKNRQNAPKIILKDSINNLDAIFTKSNSPEEESEKVSNLNGIHTYNRIIEDYNNIGGLNHLIPIIELMNNSPEELLTTENICSFFSLITLILTKYYINALKDEKFSNFFFNLGFFLEKMPDSFYTSEFAGSLINLSQILLSFMTQDIFVELNKQYHNHIMFNQKLLFKFKHAEQKQIVEQIKSVLTMVYNNNQDDSLNIDIMKIINIMLYYDKDKYNKFCCKKHSEYFNTKSEKMDPEICEVVKPFEDILKLFFKKYNNEAASFTKEGKDKDNKNANIELPKSGNDLINLFEVLTMGPSPCIQKSIINLFYEFFNENLKNANKYINLIEKDGKIFDICLFAFKSSIFDVKNDILNLIYLFLKIKNDLNQPPAGTSKTMDKEKDKEKEILPSIKMSILKEIFITNNLLPFYLFPKEELENGKIDKIKKQFYINGEEYNYLNRNETENKLYSNYNKAKIKDMMMDLYTNIYKVFTEDLFISTNLKFLIRLLTKSDISLIVTFLQNLNNAIKDKKKSDEIYENQDLLHWLLETNFQAFMIKATNYDKKKFISKFYSGNNDEKDLKSKIESINKFCNELLINIFKKDIYKLDYLLTWAKYYKEISQNNNKITYDLVLDFIINLLIEVDKSKIQKEIILCEKNDAVNIGLQKEGIYFMNLLFELITYFKYTPIKKGNDDTILLNEDNNIYEDLFSSFDTILINDQKSNKFSQSLKTKWKYYSFLKKIFQYFTPLWNKILKEENDIFGKYLENKKTINTYISEAEILFYSFDDTNFTNSNPEEPTKKPTINRGIHTIYILYHYFTNLFNLGGDKEEIKEIISDFRLFLTAVIISSCTLSTNIDKKKRKWPKSEDYQVVQLTVKNILYRAFYFFYTNLLYETFGFLLKILNRTFRQIRKEVDKKHNKKGMKGLLSKMKGIFSDSEGIKTSGPYFLMEKLYVNIGLDTNFEVKNYLDNIPHIDFKSKDVKNVTVNSKLEECIKSFIKETKIKNFFEAISVPSKEEEELNKNKLYPFIEYIKKRTQLLNMFIPCYDILPNVNYDTNDEKNEILQKLLLVSDYFPESPFEQSLNKNIKE